MQITNLMLIRMQIYAKVCKVGIKGLKVLKVMRVLKG